MAKQFNISSELTQELVAAGSGIGVNRLSLTNVQKVSSCTVDLYIEKKLEGKFYLLKGAILPIGATLIHDDISFSSKAGEFGLFIKLNNGPTFTLTGSIDPAASTTVPGVNTLFLSEIAIGDEIIVAGEKRTVTAIASNTSLTVSAAFSNNSNDATPDCNPTALVDVIIN